VIDTTTADKSELLRTSRVSGYEGHHINSVKGSPELAGEQNNIKFVKGRAGNLAERRQFPDRDNWKAHSCPN
jgi:hypothetical protein